MNKRVRRDAELRLLLEQERAKRLTEWERGGQPGPFKVMYFPTNACNLSCSICWQRKGVHSYSELNAERQQLLMMEMRELNVREFVLGGGGEPLLRWRQVKNMVQGAKQSSMYGMMFTNGTLITGEVAETLVETGWDKVLISMDGLRQANDTVRQPGSFTRIWRGLQRLLVTRGNLARPVIGIGCVLTVQGMLDLPEFIRVLGAAGIDQFNLVRLVVYKPDQRRFAVPNDRATELQATILKALEEARRQEMNTNLEQYLDREIVENAENFEEILLSTRTQGRGEKFFWNALCFEPFSNVTLHANGAVGPCCMSGDVQVASAVERSLPDIWYGPEFRKLREGILARRPEPYCRVCDINVFYENQRLRRLGSQG